MKYIYIFAATLFIVTCTIQTKIHRQQAGQIPAKLDSFKNELTASRGQLDSMRVRINSEIILLKMSVSSDKCNGRPDTIQTKETDVIPDTAPEVRTDTTDIFNRQPDCHSSILNNG